MAAAGVSSLVVTHLPNVTYLTGHSGTAGIAVLTANGIHLLVDSRYLEAVKRFQGGRGGSQDLRVWTVANGYDEALVGCLTELGDRQIGIEGDHLTVSRYQWLTAAVADAGLTLVTTSRVVEQERQVKDASEVDRLRTSARLLTPVAEAAFAAVAPGRSEREVAAAIEAALRRAGFERFAFDTIVASGPNAALPHHRSSDRVMAQGDLVVLDFGGVLDGYCSDLTRTVSVGPPSVEAQRVYGAVRRAQEAAIGAVRPGVAASGVDRAARAVLEAEDLGEAFGHGTGHGLGLEVHELPRVSRPQAGVEPARLETGMVFTVEPGAYIPGWGGVRIEDDVLVTAAGAEVLTRVPAELLAL